VIGDIKKDGESVMKNERDEERRKNDYYYIEDSLSL